MRIASVDLKPEIGPELYAPAALYAAAAAGFVIVAAPVVTWAATAVGVGGFSGAGVLAAIIAALLVFVFTANRLQPRLAPALLIALGAIGASGLINILPQLALTFTLIGAYGFAGLVPQWRRWWGAGVFAAILFALVLPFGVSAQTGAGFFLRVAVTDVAAQILNVFGVANLTAHDVLIFENSLARVDAPCSGLKSLFTGSAFFLAASIVLRRRLSPKWLGAFGAFLVLILTANIARIVILVTLIEVFNAPALAELFHIPLGLLFFVLACAAGVWFLTMVPAQATVEPEPETRRHGFSRPDFLTSLVPLAAIGLALILAPAQSDAVSFQPALAAPGEGDYTRLDLTPAETRFYNTHPQTSANKWRFERAGLSGSILMVRSTALTAMHAPEICFEANGFAVHGMETREGANGSAYRQLTVGTPAMNAVYWMQSKATVTDSFTARLSRYALHGEDDWVMVTILFDNGPGFHIKKTSAFLKELELHVAGLFAAERGIFHD